LAERAEITESAPCCERAEIAESTAWSERAEIDESPDEHERAEIVESAPRSERAVQRESTAAVERQPLTEEHQMKTATKPKHKPQHDTFSESCWCRPRLDRGVLVHNKRAPRPKPSA
jgi:hypothetical protein